MRVENTSLTVPGLPPIQKRTVIREQEDLEREGELIISGLEAVFVPKSVLGAVVRVGIGAALIALFTRR